MKLYTSIILLLIANVVLFGTLLPELISANNYEGVIAGLTLLLCAPPVNYFLIRKIIRHTKELFNKSEKKDETAN